MSYRDRLPYVRKPYIIRLPYVRKPCIIRLPYVEKPYASRLPQSSMGGGVNVQGLIILHLKTGVEGEDGGGSSTWGIGRAPQGVACVR